MVKKFKKFKKIFVLVITIICVFILLYYITGVVIHSKKEIVVPDVINKPVLEALDIVSKLNLGLKKIGEVYNPNYPLGTIVSQQPQAGMVVREGRKINVVLSLGGEKTFVPNIVGEDRRKSEILLRQYSLFIGTITERYSLKFPKNTVVQQQPQQGEVVDKNTPVDIVISLGQPPENVVLIPDFINKDINEVYQWAQKYGVEVRIKERVDIGYKNNEVIEQQPQPDEIVSERTVIEVIVAKNTNKLVEEQNKIYNFEYELPFLGDTPKNVKIIQISSEGEEVLYNKLTLPKQRIQLFVPQKKNSRIRIFVDGVLIDEK